MSFTSKAKGLGLLVIGAAGGALVQYFTDPHRGRARRSQTADQVGAAARDLASDATRELDYRAGQLEGALHEAARIGERPTPDDQTLKHRVESRVLGREGVPKGDVVVSAHDGVIELRGQVGNIELIRELVSRIREVDGVRGVQSFLHLPGEPAPNIEASLAASAQAEGGSGS